MTTPVERRVKIIFWIEALQVALTLGRLVAIIVAASFFAEEFEDFVLEDWSGSEEVRDAFRTLIKFAYIIWIIQALLEIALLVLLRQGITRKHTRKLRRWTVFGWIFIFFITLNIVLKLITNDWENYTAPTIANTAFIVVYALYRTWANLVVIVYVNDIKVDIEKSLEAEKKQNYRRPSFVTEVI